MYEAMDGIDNIINIYTCIIYYRSSWRIWQQTVQGIYRYIYIWNTEKLEWEHHRTYSINVYTYMRKGKSSHQMNTNFCLRSTYYLLMMPHWVWWNAKEVISFVSLCLLCIYVCGYTFYPIIIVIIYNIHCICLYVHRLYYINIYRYIIPHCVYKELRVRWSGREEMRCCVHLLEISSSG